MRSPRVLLVSSSLGLVLGLGLGGCLTVNDQAEFESSARALVCDWNRTCAQTMSDSGLLFDPFFPYPDDDTCEQTFDDERTPCADCRYNPSAAHKCLNRLEEALLTCDTSDIDFNACRKVYKDCSSSEVEAMCDIDDPACSVGERGRPFDGLLALGLLGLAALGRRRRRAS